MILIYQFIINFFFPVIIVVIFLRTFFNKEDKNRYKEKIYPSSYNVVRDKTKKLFWFHAASIGELNSIIPLIKKLNTKNNDFLITTVTLSSSKLFFEEFKDSKNIIHRFLPVDKKKLVKKFIETWSPNLAVFVDSEIWPNFILQIKKNKIPLYLLNARITKKTFLKWNLVPKTAKKIFQSFDLGLSYSKETKEYLKKLGLKEIKYYGNLKLASEIKLNNLDEHNKIFLKKNKYWCAVSTHKEEDEFCIKTHKNLKEKYQDIKTIIIPRHIDRVKKIKKSCDSFGINAQILSKKEKIKPEKEFYIINSYGETHNYLSLCKCVFIGKSMIKKLEPVGGQSPIEAAKLGCKIYHGPYVNNFREIYDLFNNLKISEKITGDKDLANKISDNLKEFDKIKEINISVLNNLGEEILNNTANEFKKFI